MANKLNEGVGKKIVEALKKQSEGELEPIETNTVAFDGLIPNLDEAVEVEAEPTEDISDEMLNESFADMLKEPELDVVEQIAEPVGEPEIEPLSFDEPKIDLSSFMKEEPAKPQVIYHELPDVELPSNILILKKLIAQLPSGVTRHTGAQIIKQTMEALGISMKSVLKEAQDVQDGLKESARECQATILEYKKQIALHEKQAQNFQRQYGALNDLISLFIQTTK